MQRRSRESWARLVAELEAGDDTIAEVARRNGVHPETLRWWRAKLRGERATTALLPVRVVGEPHGGESMSIVVGMARVELRAGADPEYVAAIARALVRGC